MIGGEGSGLRKWGRGAIPVWLRRSRSPATMTSMRDPSPNTKIKPERSLLLLFGSIGPLGHLPASGTCTVVAVGVPVFYASSEMAPLAYAGLVVVFSLASVWLHGRGDELLGEKDSRKLVWDELAGFLVAVAFLPVFTWQLAVAAVILERFFDVTKFPPANWVERRAPGGWGVVGDDLVAGVYTCVLLHLGRYYLPGPLGL